MTISVEQAIKFIEDRYTFSETSCKEAWQTLKSAVLAQQTTNTGSPKLPELEDIWDEVLASGMNEDLSHGEQVYRAVEKSYEVIVRQLRAGA
jgi:hypothetical protein